MWTTSSTSSPDEEWLRRMGAPENELPVVLPLDTVLARTDDVALALVGLRVHTTGLAFDLAARARPAAAAGLHLDEVLWGHRRTAAGGDFLFGVEFADGRRGSTAVPRGGVPRPGLASGGGGVVLTQGGGSGGPTSVDQSWWLSPLPPEGPLRFVVRCDALGIAETTVELDGAVIRRAAERVVQLWPWAPPPEEPPAPAPALPPGSWFAG
jgi:hypothetical protein